MIHNKVCIDGLRNESIDDTNMTKNERLGYYISKRILDVLIASILLVLLMPVMLIVALLIYIYSPGPVIFTQQRVGAKRKRRGCHTCWEQVVFNCYKFRTMKPNSDSSVHQSYVKALIENDQQKMDEIQGQATRTLKLIHDPRIIRPGVLLRKLSLDELPQFVNVLLGDMSLVGPRPAIPYEVEMYKPWQRQRLEAQPGITGLQQVVARCASSFDEQVRLDIKYIHGQSLWLDIKIIIKTPLAILSTKGAG